MDKKKRSNTNKVRTIKSKKKTNTKQRKNNKKKSIFSIFNNKRVYMVLILLVFLATLLIFATYAWFSTSLNVKINTFNMIVTRNSGLTISFDAINYGSSVEMSKEKIFEELTPTYPNHRSQWASNGLVPVSTVGLSNNNSYFFDYYATDGIKYRNTFTREGPYFYTRLYKQDGPRHFAGFIAFDLFFRNDNNESPVSDDLYFDYGTSIKVAEDISEQMNGLVNSMRMAIVKVGSADIDEDPTVIQNLQCNNNCEAIIFEPNSTFHTGMSIEKAKEYGINLRDGERYDTYASVKAVGPFKLENAVSGSVLLDRSVFELQETITEDDFDIPIFDIPHGVTKTRFYIWIEGQDIDSLETDSEGTDVDISINFIKDTAGWDAYN